MKNEIYSLWYKHPSQLINTPQMSLMVRKEGIESYGLYMHLADTLHLVGGFQEYDFNDICLILGYTKKNIKATLGRVINDYKLFDFYTNDDGIEMIGLERLKEDIEALSNEEIMDWIEQDEKLVKVLSSYNIPIEKFRWRSIVKGNKLIIKGKTTVLCVLKPLIKPYGDLQHVVESSLIPTTILEEKPRNI
jgi:hypothetical protein